MKIWFKKIKQEHEPTPHVEEKNEFEKPIDIENIKRTKRLSNYEYSYYECPNCKIQINPYGFCFNNGVTKVNEIVYQCNGCGGFMLKPK